MNNLKLQRNVYLGALILACTILSYLGMQSFKEPKESTKFDYNPVPIINNTPNRPLNTSFQPNSVRGTFGSYTVTVVRNINLANLSASGVVYFEVSQDNSSWTVINSAGVTSALAVALSVGISDTFQYNIQGMIPKGYYCRLRTTTSGGATVTMSSGQETMF